MMAAQRLLPVILTHMTIRDVIQLAEASRPADGVIRCLIYVRISMDKAHDGHGVANQMAKLEKKARERGWTVVYRLSDNDIGVTRKDPTKPGKYRPGYEEAMRLVDACAVDAVLCFKWDRFIREPLDLEYLIPRFDRAGVRFAEVDGNIDLGTDSGRLAARILIAVAKAEQERKAERQKLANEQAAINGRRFLGGPRPFGYLDDHVTADPVEGPAVAEACAALLGGGSISGIMREWISLELTPPQRERRGTTRWNRASIRSILLNPRIAGLSVYHEEIVGQGQWEPLVSEETWRAVRGILEDPARKPPRGVRTLLGGIALCPCGNVAVGGQSHTGNQVYRCSVPTRDRSRPGGHVARKAAEVDEFIEKLAIGRLSRADAADLVTDNQGGPDVAGLREEAAAIRRNLEEMAADRAVGLISRPQLLAATGRANLRLGEIGAELEHAARENVLAPLVAAENAAELWEGLDLSRKRAVIKTLMSITLHSPGRGARRPFDPATVTITWRHEQQG
jgi:DNA invertase Pin-like site-specific DNA recombinase